MHKCARFPLIVKSKSTMMALAGTSVLLGSIRGAHVRRPTNVLIRTRREVEMRYRLLATLVVLGVVLTLVRQTEGTAAQDDPRYFAESGFRIDNDLVWDFFVRYGGTRAVGLPISRTFLLLGLPTQLFERHLVQVSETDEIQVISLLDSGWMPYVQIAGRPLPYYDTSLTVNAPVQDSPRYVDAMMAYLRANLPATVDGQPTDFFRTFDETIAPVDRTITDPFESAARTLRNLDIWGIPTSRPLRDPNIAGVISVRLERGVFRYDAACRCTFPLPLAWYFRAVLTGNELPADLELQAPDSPYLRQYDLASHTGPYRPWALPETDLTYAFLPSLESPPLLALPGGEVAMAPTSTPVPRPGIPTPTPMPTSAPEAAAEAPAPTSTSGPTSAPGPINRRPADITLRVNEAGPETTLVTSVGGEDGRAVWHSVRYERDRSLEVSALGPNIIYNQVYVARNVELARQIYGEQIAVRNFPESVDRFGLAFFLDPPRLGEESQVLASCIEDGCAATDYKIHIRLVFRNQNIVSVFYTYGDQAMAKLSDVIFAARRVAGRMEP